MTGLGNLLRIQCGLMRTSEANRPLCSTEQAIWLMDQAASCNGLVVAHVRGPLDEALLRECLRRQQLRHPPLRVYVEERPGGALGLTDAAARPIPLRVVPAAGPDTWHAVVEEEIERRFGPGDNPLYRMALVRGEPTGEHVLVISHHHVVSDALS